MVAKVSSLWHLVLAYFPSESFLFCYSILLTLAVTKGHLDALRCLEVI